MLTAMNDLRALAAVPVGHHGVPDYVAGTVRSALDATSRAAS
jgi:hypothetical protein